MILRRSISFLFCPIFQLKNPYYISMRNVNKLRINLRKLSTLNEDKILVRFVTNEKSYEAYGKIGDSLLDVVVNNDIPLDGYGACEGTIACCTCHVILEKNHFDRLPKPEEEELDMLDLAPELNDLSRLGCQVILTSEDKPSVTLHVPSVKIDARTIQS